jgi:hypothetical protein
MTFEEIVGASPKSGHCQKPSRSCRVDRAQNPMDLARVASATTDRRVGYVSQWSRRGRLAQPPLRFEKREAFSLERPIHLTVRGVGLVVI